MVDWWGGTAKEIMDLLNISKAEYKELVLKKYESSLREYYKTKDDKSLEEVKKLREEYQSL